MPRFTIAWRRIAPAQCMLSAALLPAVLVASLAANVAADEPDAVESKLSGKEIFAQQCAECHGGHGEGVADAREEPLHGDLPVEDLAIIIHDTMPEGAPEECVDESAEAVAQYIYETFYTAQARAKNQQPRIELSRLTVPQYINSVADLLSDSSRSFEWGEERGLSAEYYNSRNFRRQERKIERTDPQIDFDFGEKSPKADEIQDEEFSMRWEGSLFAHESGDYEFCLKTENGARLWVNDDDRALIDGWVSSGGEVRELRATLPLIGGRAYPIRVDYFKYKDKTASIELEWKPPHKAWEVIPERHLTPREVPSTFVVTTAFPPDDSSVGYERGTSVSRAWHEAATFAAIETANHVVERLDRYADSQADDEDRPRKLREFCYRLAERAFRRPLTDEEKQTFVDDQFEQTETLDLAVKRSVLLILQSPRFLYPQIAAQPEDDYQVATRLALALWDSLPDETLRKAAAQGELKTPEQVTRHAQRLLSDPRAKAKVQAFFHHWLELDEAEEITKDVEAFPGFDDQFISDLRTSLEMFLNEVVWAEQSDYRHLLLADYLFVNDRMAEFYGLQTPDGDGFHKVADDSHDRAGVMTHPLVLSMFAYHKSTSPIHRGVFLTRKVMGRALKPPPEAIQFMEGQFEPHLTMREKVAALTGSDNCQNCHRIINPLGFSLEHFDAVGRFRSEENGKPIDAASDYPSISGEPVRIAGARDVAEQAVASSHAQQGFVEQLFHHVVKQPVYAYGPDRLEKLHASFEQSEFNIQKLLVRIATVSALRGDAQP
ncbi:MAG: DUF1592 domain-containing protein [Pirellulales bacterium]